MRTRGVLFVIGTIITAAAFAAGGGFAVGAASAPPIVTPPPPGAAQGSAPQQDAKAIAAAARIATQRSESVFVALTPCRIVDTRLATGAQAGALPIGGQRTYAVTGTTGIAAQGGASGGCGVPPSATAIAGTISSVGQSARGYLRAWQAGAAAPTATVLNYGTDPITTGVTIPVRPGGGDAVVVRSFLASTHVVIDVTGYYAPQMHGLISPSGDIYSGSSRVVSSTRVGTGSATVTFDQDISHCTPMVDTYNAGPNVYGAAYAFDGATAQVFTWYLNSSGQPVPADFYFYISVVC